MITKDRIPSSGLEFYEELKLSFKQEVREGKEFKHRLFDCDFNYEDIKEIFKTKR